MRWWRGDFLCSLQYLQSASVFMYQMRKLCFGRILDPFCNNSNEDTGYARYQDQHARARLHMEMSILLQMSNLRPNRSIRASISPPSISYWETQCLSSTVAIGSPFLISSACGMLNPIECLLPFTNKDTGP